MLHSYNLREGFDVHSETGMLILDKIQPPKLLAV